jgi:hypothetical protein
MFFHDILFIYLLDENLSPNLLSGEKYFGFLEKRVMINMSIENGRENLRGEDAFMDYFRLCIKFPKIPQKTG